MPAVNIKVAHDDDEVAWPEINVENIVDVPDEAMWNVAIMEHGMGSGLPSVALNVRLPDGTEVVAQTSVAIWSSVTIAARGAFPEAFVGGPLADLHSSESAGSTHDATMSFSPILEIGTLRTPDELTLRFKSLAALRAVNVEATALIAEWIARWGEA